MKIGKKIIILLVISLFLAMFITLMLLYRYFDVMLHADGNEAEKEYYFYSIQHEDNPINKNIESFDNVYNNLKKYEDDKYTYYELYFQYLENIDEEDWFYSEETNELVEDCYAIKCMQVSENVLYKTKCADGRLFVQNDYVYDGNGELPIIMGNAYKTRYCLGDTFELYYLFDKYKFKVIGFLEEESNIHIGTYKLNLDKYIIMPSFEIENDVQITDGIKIHYANKTSGVIKISNDQNTFFNDIIKNFLIDTEAGEYSWTAYPIEIQFKETFGISIFMLKIIIVILEFFSLLGSIMIIFKISKYECRQEKKGDYNDLFCGSIIFIFTSLFYCIINYVYLTLAGIIVYKDIHFIIIGLISYIIVLFKKMICKNMNNVEIIK